MLANKDTSSCTPTFKNAVLNETLSSSHVSMSLFLNRLTCDGSSTSAVRFFSLRPNHLRVDFELANVFVEYMGATTAIISFIVCFDCIKMLKYGEKSDFAYGQQCDLGGGRKNATESHIQLLCCGDVFFARIRIICLIHNMFNYFGTISLCYVTMVMIT